MDATAQVLAQDPSRVLHPFVFADSDREQVAFLLDFYDPAEGAHIVDMGAGLGAVAEHMQALRPDLSFTLVNCDAGQLAEAPEQFAKVRADFHDTGLASGAFDAVMFNASLAQGYFPKALREAARLLRPGGQLYIYDFVREGGNDLYLRQTCLASAISLDAFREQAEQAGFMVDAVALPEGGDSSRWRALFPSPALAEVALDGVRPALWRMVRAVADDPIADAFLRHQRIAFHFSGGRDSLAALYRLKPYWDRMTVYHVDAGDQFPEVKALVAQVAAELPHFVTVAGRVRDTWFELGMPSDIVPAKNTAFGRQVRSGRPVPLIGRYECCARSLMAPMHERMIADGITLIIRGQRDEDYSQAPARSGDFADGFEVLYPIQDWRAEQVMAYLAEIGVEPAPFYAHGVYSAPECMTCTAWLDDKKAAYLKEHHPTIYPIFHQRLRLVRREVSAALAELDAELEI